MKRGTAHHPHHGDHGEHGEPPVVPALVTVFLACALAGLALFNSIHAQGARAALAAAQLQAAAAARPPDPPPPQQQQPAPDPSLQILLETRVCGSPAVDGYANVKPECLFASPTARWYRGWVAGGGDPAALVAHLEAASDIDGIAVKWGIGNKHDSAEGCARDCWCATRRATHARVRAHRPGQVDGPFKELPCNAFSWCGAPVCFEPDAHNHTQGDCWLKWAEAPASPELNMRGDLPPDYRKRHPTAPPRAQWVAGVLLPPGVGFTNGSWSPRWAW
ncbi:MAG: hypothetical protein J3K34DRAFT_120330 [Monoraphidium minutum]|nr:MAG: hypothetical protein J3K34DRAFT_120330 [Monoraphidium minutum]